MIPNVTLSAFDYDLEPIFLNEDMSNKLFCTFATQRTRWTGYWRRFKIGTKSYIIKSLYSILNPKMNTSVLTM